MSNRRNLAFLRKHGIELNSTWSYGGGNRDHSSWQIEFVGPGVPGKFIALQVRCMTYSGKFDGKRACEREAVERAMGTVARLAGRTLPDNDYDVERAAVKRGLYLTHDPRIAREKVSMADHMNDDGVDDDAEVRS